MPRINIKDHIQGKKLDLCLKELDEVPVNDILQNPKATILDISCNSLLQLPESFSKLTHLVVLDLSKNHLESLPKHFGDLINLESLDLYRNNLKTFPLSFCRLYKLRFLDIKGNPIHETLRKVAGPCDTDAGCKTCARNVVSFMKQADLQNEKQKAAKQKEIEELDQTKRELEQTAREREKRIRQKEKELEKERKKLEFEQNRHRRLSQVADEDVQNFLARDENVSLQDLIGASKQETVRAAPDGSCSRFFRYVFTIGAVVALTAIIMSWYCGRNPYSEYCETYDDMRHGARIAFGELGGLAWGVVTTITSPVSGFFGGDNSTW